MTMKTIYIAEDEEGIREIYGQSLTAVYRVKLFPHAESVLEAFQEQEPHLLLTDHKMGKGLTGDELISHVRMQGYQGPVLMVSGMIPEKTSYTALQKPVSMRELKRTIEHLLQ